MKNHLTSHEMNSPLIINICPTGMVPRKDCCPAVPISVREIATDVYRCYNQGASMVHLHARDDDEAPTWRQERFEEIIADFTAKHKLEMKMLNK